MIRFEQALASKTSRREGFTIAELMVSLVIMVIVTGQLSMILLTQNRVYAVQKRVLDAQGDARLIAEIISSDLRSAGFLIPKIVGISSRDGAGNASDAICISDPLVISAARIADAKGTFNRVGLAGPVAAEATSIRLDSLDVDLDTVDDFSVGAGIIISDGTDSLCARITAIDIGTKGITFAPPAPANPFSIAQGAGIATPALVYEVGANGLTRNGALLSSRIEGLQVQYAIDIDGDELIDGTLANPGPEFPIHDLAGQDPSKILAVELSVIARSSVADPDFLGSGMPAIANHGGGAPDGIRRRVITVTVSPRNF